MIDAKEILEQTKLSVFSRNDIYENAIKMYPDFKKTQMRYLIGRLLDNKDIVRVARNRYIAPGKSHCKGNYTGKYSERSVRIIDIVSCRYPMLDFRIWELTWLNEFLNHQIARNKILLEVEESGCEYIYTLLSEEFDGAVLLKPNEEDLYRYGRDDGIVVGKLVKESPKGSPIIYSAPLEKIIVDMFANKLLRSMLSGGDYPEALTEMFDKYVIDQSKLFRYARRRNKETVIRDYLSQKTSVVLIDR